MLIQLAASWIMLWPTCGREGVLHDPQEAEDDVATPTIAEASCTRSRLSSPSMASSMKVTGQQEVDLGQTGGDSDGGDDGGPLPTSRPEVAQDARLTRALVI